MLNLIKPKRLSPGDTVAAVSLSWGGAGNPRLRWRYELAKKRLFEQFGLRLVEMENTLKGAKYLYEHPEKRAEDLLRAFADPEIKGVFSCIGGEESVRMLPYIDFEVIRSNPKIFLGYSDSTIAHLICLKAGVSSFYGPSLLAEFAENVKIFDYTADWFKKVLFDDAVIGDIPASASWTGERVEWTPENAEIMKQLLPNMGYEFLQGAGKVAGRLIGGCAEVLEMAKGTQLWPDSAGFDGAILFLETSEEMPPPNSLEYWLRNYATQGLLQKLGGIVFGKPYQETHYDAYKEKLLKVLREEHLERLPVVYNMSIGHNAPMCTLPYGALAEIDCSRGTFSILESGVI
ncbi:Muramoyltetrapeptide carboxypeptidase LdcA (peptidoglycan recycling) [Sporobacter termitidis DSM 10068]|uniref:Muramoyltetrapeptide carboxypeptidase LdcA (Peptidoglycan recycling) n=1 Tax=Sporobacter termitidis DSM 10068 TaxID=1123282 RepID=A0A1M5YWI3_9FIRM|nr:S66 peptidase family protein [Sporobacter termitidis]SHI16200.1 Muramoyltetrapeptide carboxypeptidase LdcA (peptidoglycan recycling) [Sporobacter termitidis DSM 10068]